MSIINRSFVIGTIAIFLSLAPMISVSTTQAQVKNDYSWLNGDWDGGPLPLGGNLHLKLEVDGNGAITGNGNLAGNSGRVSGTVKGNKVSLEISLGRLAVVNRYDLTYKDGKLIGVLNNKVAKDYFITFWNP